MRIAGVICLALSFLLLASANAYGYFAMQRMMAVSGPTFDFVRFHRLVDLPGLAALLTLPLSLAGLLLLLTAGVVERARVRAREGRRLCGGCGYDLRGTLAADGEACPECGRGIPARQRIAASEGQPIVAAD